MVCSEAWGKVAMFQKVLAILGVRVPLRVLRIGLSLLSVVVGTLTFLGLMTAAALKTDPLATRFLAFYPRYTQAMEGVKILEEMDFSVPSGGTDEKGQPLISKVGILSIDEPQWPVMFDFIQSEIAIRKSERNDPSVRVPLEPPPPPNAFPPTKPTSDTTAC